MTETVNDVVVNTMTYSDADRPGCYGNILSKNGVTYEYDSVWKDRLVKVGNDTITYDAQGNPTSYLGHALTWEKGRQLKSFQKKENGVVVDTISYTYNANGIRTSKTVGGVRHDYLLDGAKILREAWNYNANTGKYADVLTPLYDNEESVCGIVYKNTPYYFLKNLQGDVIAIVNKDAETVARYSYDAWGVCTVEQDSTGIANINPFRYRGYYYDQEIGMYYLQSRYYDPTVGRFVNADEVETITSIGIQYKSTLFTYVENNPINNIDAEGYFSLNTVFKFIGNILSKITTKIKDFFKSLYKRKDGILYVSTTVVALTIDLIISVIISSWVSDTIKGLLKSILKLYFKKGSQKGVQLAKKILQWFTKNSVGKTIAKLLLSVLTSLALSLVGLKKPLATTINSIVTDCLGNIVTMQNKLAKRVTSLISAFSSVGGLIAFLLDIADSVWDDYCMPIPIKKYGMLPVRW